MSYSHIGDHRSMVFDAVRNEAYLRALRAEIRPETVLMDLGAGLGVFGLKAAAMGAARVLLVEPSPVIEVARAVAQANRLDNVQCFASRVEELELAVEADVIVSVFTGNFLLSEDLLPSLFHARDNFLAPGGQLIPHRARMHVVPVTVREFYHRQVECWAAGAALTSVTAERGLDYSSVRPYAANNLYMDSWENFDPVVLSAPARLLEMDFSTAKQAACDESIGVAVERDGTCHGWLGWFDMCLGDKWLSTSGKNDTTHWRPAFLPLERPIEVRAGECLEFALKRPEFGEWTWTTTYADQRQRQSTFLSQPLPPTRLERLSNGYRPTLGRSGEAAKWLLGQMAGQSSVSELAAGLQAHYPDVFRTESGALDFVRQLAERYS